jgi:hypothetical protein
MYSVVGPDGQVYGPADAGLMRVWCREGRITAETQIVDPFDDQVKKASAIPEIAQYLPVIAPPLPVPPVIRAQQAAYGAPASQAPSIYNMSHPPARYDTLPPITYGPPRNKMLAILFALFLGVFGMHRFYLARPATGFAMLFMTVFSFGFAAPLTFIWALFDLVMIATGELRDGADRALV